MTKNEFIQALIDSIEKCTIDGDPRPAKCGVWECEAYEVGLYSYTATCSVCGYESTDYYRITVNHKFCENCGAKMKTKGDL